MAASPPLLGRPGPVQAVRQQYLHALDPESKGKARSDLVSPDTPQSDPFSAHAALTEKGPSSDPSQRAPSSQSLMPSPQIPPAILCSSSGKLRTTPLLIPRHLAVGAPKPKKTPLCSQGSAVSSLPSSHSGQIRSLVGRREGEGAEANVRDGETVETSRVFSTQCVVSLRRVQPGAGAWSTEEGCSPVVP